MLGALSYSPTHGTHRLGALHEPVLEIRQDGTIWAAREVIYDPVVDDWGPLEKYLRQKALICMPRDPERIPVPLVLVRPRELVPLETVQRIMDLCGKQGIQADVELEVAQGEVAGS
jgi:hypothetical protein